MKILSNGIYQQVISTTLQQKLESMDDSIRNIEEPLPIEDGALQLAQYLHPIIRQTLDCCKGPNKSEQQRTLVERLLDVCASVLGESEIQSVRLRKDLAVLKSVSPKIHSEPIHPDIPISMTDLLVNGSHDRSLGSQLQKEIVSADRIDLLCSFLKWSGFRLVQPMLQKFLNDGKSLRVLTTTYMGATESRVVEELLSMGAEVRISYDSTKTRLHAKTWYLHRDSGFSTCFLGSSNLSHAALLEGVEWNVRLSIIDNRGVVQKIASTFEQYWHSSDFEPYTKELFIHHSKRQGVRTLLPNIDIKPRSYQAEMLTALATERELGFTKNLLVAATGTGKTMVAALDFKRLQEQRKVKTLLFVAHRKEILEQALGTYRLVLKHNTFGEILGAGYEPQDWNIVFAMVQTLKGRLKDLPKEHFDVVVVDESHHSNAGTYRTILDHVTPKFLLGLTATPERMDGQSILGFFDNRTAYEMRLWDALDQEVLCPFQYFMSNVDTLDLRAVKWQNGGYNIEDLGKVYTGNDFLFRQMVSEINRVVLNPASMRCLAFCVNISHAEYMAQRLTDVGILSVAITSKSQSQRDEVLQRLQRGEIQCICCVDMFNEGVDVPNIDTVLFLRPTQSQTVFLQQLGRGLRRDPSKSCLTVLDFVGQVHEKFQFAQMFKALIGGTTASLRRAIEDDFPKLPSGCSIVLDRVAKKTVLSRLQIASGIRGFVSELASTGDCTLDRFLTELNLEVEDFYYNSRISFTSVRERCGFIEPVQGCETYKLFERALCRGVYLNNLPMLQVFAQFLSLETPVLDKADGNHRWIAVALGLGHVPISQWEHKLEVLWGMKDLRSEWIDYVRILKHRSSGQQKFNVAGQDLYISSLYTRQDVMAIFDLRENSGKIKNIREGVYYHRQHNVDLFFVTLKKTSDNFSVSTMYEDYPISPDLFHWQSQSGTHDQTSVGKRYTRITGASSNKAVLFVRHGKKDGQGRTQPFMCLGPCTYVRHEGNKPMSIVWRLKYSIPFSVYQTMKKAAG